MREKALRLARRVWPWLLAGALIGLLLALIDPRGAASRSWTAFALLGALAGAIVFAAWSTIGPERPPSYLRWALFLAFGLRLLVGVGLTWSLPSAGYDQPHQNEGYLFPDAYRRDQDAWARGRSDAPLWIAFTDPKSSDQYGGLMLLSAGIYRYFGSAGHHPLMLILITASVSAAGVVFAWAFAAMVFGERAASLAAWIMALFPESVLLGATQMREPFLATALALAVYGYARVRIGAVRGGFSFLLAGLLLTIFVSPPFGILLLGIIGAAWIWEGRTEGRLGRWVFVPLLALAAFAFLLTVSAWSRLEFLPWESVRKVVLGWFFTGADFELRKLVQASGWMQKIFALVPAWSHHPLAAVYGLVRPFLPSALMDSDAAPLLRVIVSWRALGWYLLLPFLMYAPLAALRTRRWRGLPLFLSAVVWLTAFLAAYRAVDDWDNPRYRAVFLALQAGLAGWAWMRARQQRSPWLMRTAVVIGIATLAFLHWEAGRYYRLPRLDLWETLGVIVVVSLGYLIAGWLLDRNRREPPVSLTGRTTEV